MGHPQASSQHALAFSPEGAGNQMAPQVQAESLLKQLSDGVLVCAKDGEVLYLNPAFARLLGFSEEDILKKNVAKDLVERGLDWQALVSLLDQGGTCEDYEMKFRRADGGTACCSISASLMRDPGAALVGLAIVLRDITTRKGWENDLRERAYRTDILNKIAKISSGDNDQRYRALAKTVPELQKLVNFDVLTVGLTEENGRHVEVMGIDPEHEPGIKTLGKVLFEGSIVQKLRLGGIPILIGKDAGQRPFTELSVLDARRVQSLLSVPLTSRARVFGSLNLGYSRENEYNIDVVDTLQMVADQVAGIIDNMDLVESLKARVRLHEVLVRSSLEIQKAISTEQIYAIISENLREVVSYKDISFYLVDWQTRSVTPVYAISKYSDEMMASSGTVDQGIVGAVAKSGSAEFTDDVDEDPRVFQVPGVPPEHDAMLALPLFGTEGVIGVLELYRPKGDVFTVTDLEIGKLFAQQASVALANATLISKLQEAKKEIEMLNDLMFHDINNFNFATLNYMQMLAADPGLSKENRAHLEKSIQIVKQTSDLIESVKKLTKIGFISPKDFDRVDLAMTLNRVVSRIETSFPSKKVSVSVRGPPAASVMANNLIDELFFNILDNAVKYDPHTEVEIDVDCERVVQDGRPSWKVSISDRGSGISDDKKQRLFHKYERLRKDMKVSGTGLGLSISKALVDKFGGGIWVEDRVPGQSELGARFCVTLPMAR